MYYKMGITKYNGLPKEDINDDVVIIDDAEINEISKIKINGTCKVLFIIDSYYVGHAKKIIKAMRKNDDDAGDSEREFMESNYNFDLTGILNLEIVIDACDRMQHDCYVGVASNKCQKNVIEEVDQDGDRICDFVAELKEGEIKTTISKSDIDELYDMYCE